MRSVARATDERRSVGIRIDQRDRHASDSDLGQFFKGEKMERLAKCSCGKLSATASGPPLKVSVCHCKSCQRRTGSAFGVAVFFSAVNVACAGESGTYVRAGDSGQDLTFHFCPSCGSTVYWMPDFRPGLVAIALGCFDDATDLAPGQSVYNDAAYSWVSLRLE